MGVNLSTSFPPLREKIFIAISISSLNSLVLLYAGPEEIYAVRHAIISKWKKGIKQENHQRDSFCYEFKLNGFPFQEDGIPEMDSIQSRMMIAAIYKALDNLGWELLVASDLSFNGSTSTCVLKRREKTCRRRPILYSSFFSIGLESSDKLQINECPEELHDLIKEICEERWWKGVQNEAFFGSTYEIKLYRFPWEQVDKTDSCNARKMLIEIIERLSMREYQFFGTCNIAGDTDTLFFKHVPFQRRNEYLIVSLNRTDRIRLMNGPDEIYDIIKETVREHWPKGLHDLTIDSECYEMKLKGNPWLSTGRETVDARRLISQIMTTLAAFGYFVLTSLDVSRKVNDKSVLVFRKEKEELSTSFMCVTPHKWNKMRFLDAPDEIVDAGRNVISRYYSEIGYQERTSEIPGVTYQVMLNRMPWQESKTTGIYGKAMLIGLLCEFQSLGWHLVCSADVTGTIEGRGNNERSNSLHSWWFMYDPDRRN